MSDKAFDPEKVERIPAYRCTGAEDEYVSASDYDSLLKLYRDTERVLRPDWLS